MAAILFSKQGQITLRKSFLAICILCGSDEANCNIKFQNILIIFKQLAMAAMLVF